MKSIIHQLWQLKRITNFPFQLNEIGIMVKHCQCVKNKVLDRYFFCFSYNREKYDNSKNNLLPTFSILAPGEVINSDGTRIHDELFFSYSVSQNNQISQLFNLKDGKLTFSTSISHEFSNDLLKLKELLLMRNTLGVADKLDALAMQMIMTAYANSFKKNGEQKISVAKPKSMR